MFFNIGGGEILVIAMVALIAVGPEQLPSVLRKAGRAMAQVRSMTSGLRDEFMSGIDEVTDLAKPEAWMGKGLTDDPVVPAGYAERQKAAEQAAKEESDAGSSTVGDSEDSSNGDGPVVNQIAKANARSSEDVDRPKPSIGGISTAAPRTDDDAPVDDVVGDDGVGDDSPVHNAAGDDVDAADSIGETATGAGDEPAPEPIAEDESGSDLDGDRS